MTGWRASVRRTRTLLKVPHFQVVEDRVRVGRETFDYVYRLQGPVVHLLAVTPRGQAVLVRQYRHPVRRTLLELPAGKVESGERPLAAAKRELREETGYAATRWVHLGGWPLTPASSTMTAHYLLATGARLAAPAAPERTEFLRVELVPLRGLWRRLSGTRATTASSLLCLALALDRLGDDA